MAKIERTEQRGIIVAKLLETMRLLIEKIKNSQKKKIFMQNMQCNDVYTACFIVDLRAGQP